MIKCTFIHIIWTYKSYSVC